MTRLIAVTTFETDFCFFFFSYFVSQNNNGIDIVSTSMLCCDQCRMSIRIVLNELVYRIKSLASNGKNGAASVRGTTRYAFDETSLRGRQLWRIVRRSFGGVVLLCWCSSSDISRFRFVYELLQRRRRRRRWRQRLPTLSMQARLRQRQQPLQPAA